MYFTKTSCGFKTGKNHGRATWSLGLTWRVEGDAMELVVVAESLGWWIWHREVKGAYERVRERMG